jgi:signal transduction histidine kinase
MDLTFVVVVVLTVPTIALAVVVALHHREKGALLGREDQLRQRLWEVEDEFRRHLATMRRAGFDTQPADEAWETHTISEEAEAEIEAERHRTWLAGDS